MSNRQIARELVNRNLGSFEGRNDRVELLPRVKAQLGGAAPQSPAGTYLMLHARVWFDIETGTWHSITPPGRIGEQVANELAERVIWAVQEALSAVV